MNTQEETKIDIEQLKKLGTRIRDHVPPERRPYDFQRPEGSAGILAQNTAPRHYEFDIKPS